MWSQKGVVDDDVVKRYSSDYESNLDPFAAFSSKVRCGFKFTLRPLTTLMTSFNVYRNVIENI